MVTMGQCILIDDQGEHVMRPGDCAAFPANDGNGHQFVNRTDKVAKFLVIGTKAPQEVATYSDVDLRVERAFAIFEAREPFARAFGGVGQRLRARFGGGGGGGERFKFGFSLCALSDRGGFSIQRLFQRGLGLVAIAGAERCGLLREARERGLRVLLQGLKTFGFFAIALRILIAAFDDALRLGEIALQANAHAFEAAEHGGGDHFLFAQGG